MPDEVVILGGHAVSLLVSLLLFLPAFAGMAGRRLLALAALSAAAGALYLSAFDLAASGDYLAGSPPVIITGLLLLAFFWHFFRKRPIPLPYLAFVAAVLIPILWASFINLMALHSCFMGACA